jgi:hypothetical protein
MNAIEIEEAVSELALAPFDKEEFPYAFLMAFGNKETRLSVFARALQTSQTWVAYFRPTMFI